jgi:hypothetical protein
MPTVATISQEVRSARRQTMQLSKRTFLLLGFFGFVVLCFPARRSWYFESHTIYVAGVGGAGGVQVQLMRPRFDSDDEEEVASKWFHSVSSLPAFSKMMWWLFTST